MRISNVMLTDNYLNNLNNNLQKLMHQQQQMATGKRITKLSDDPVGAISIMNSDVNINRIEQYQKNVTNAQAWVNQTESALLELNDVVASAYETAVSSANDSMTAVDKRAVAAKIGQLRDHIVSLANAKSGEKYLFGGYNTINPPFEVDGGTGAILYNGIDMSNAADPALIAEGEQIIQYEVSYDLQMDLSIPGTELLGTGDENVYNILDDFYDALESDASATELSEYIGKLQDVQSRLLSRDSEIGGLTNRLELIMTRHEDDYLNYKDIKSQVEDVDQAEAITNFTMTQSMYTASLHIAGSIIQLSLVDFLK